ncbi:endonuclease/exonuclease/phosphatase family protein [Tenacibaculum sp. 190524A05c]|uniref:Endonuclease/exonuclease/phosphatase family metal-dependent hydrolase n=1 Tax=Tenacibaculum platacis TaxID=3137852 RepID=A0ABP1EH20_9FLAO
MKKVASLLLKLVVLLMSLVVVFYFWGSNATMEKEDYQKLFTNNYEQDFDNDSIFSIVTYNIGYLSGMTNNTTKARPKELFDRNLSHVKKEFQQLNPDVIAFQEIDYGAKRSYLINQEEELSKLGYNHVARTVNWDKKYVPFPYFPPSAHFGKVVSGQSILSKFPIKNHERVVLERVENTPFYKNAFYLDRLLQIVKLEIKGKEVVLMNVHLEAFDKETRVKQLKVVVQKFLEFGQSNPTILLGDFNSDPNFEDPAIAQVLNLENIGNAAFSKSGFANTFDSKKPYKRLDYIFYTKNFISYVDGRVLSEFAQSSDHLPVSMKFKLK